MALTPVNNPPAPVQEQVNPAIPGVGDCATIKEEFGIETGTYSSHNGSTGGGGESHHVLQDAAAKGIISRGPALCVLLAGGAAGTEHQTVSNRQNDRMYNKKRGSGAVPASDFGGLKAQSKADLSAGLEGKRTSKRRASR